MIPVEQYDIMQNKYNGPPHMMDTIIWIILFRYQLLSSNNNQLAVLPKIYKKMEEDFGLSVECFASAINSSSEYFCSLYYDVEKYFGSIGNFFNIIPIKGTYSFNPPYQYDVITNGIKKILEHLSNSSNIKEELTFIITIPIWDNYGKDYMAQNMVENNNNIIKYDEFEIMNEIRNSIYFKGLRMISKDEFTYMDHNFYLFKNKTIQNTYVIVMSNYECNFIDKINKYNFYSY
jgi:phosphorylated CTD-interacting factor 1